jgi:hypothetical protein
MKIRLSIDTGSSPPTTFEHAGPVVHIGRDPDCELSLQGEASSAVSRRHARIDLSVGGATLTDLGSSNGTQLNGQLLDGAAPLRTGDHIQMGFTGATLTVLELDLAASPPTKAVAVPRVALVGAAAAIVLAAAVVVGVILFYTPKTPPEYAQGPSTEIPAAPHPVDTGKPPPPVMPAPDTAKRPAPSPAETTAKGVPSGEVKEVGSYVALDGWVSVLLQRQGETYPWGVLRPESKVSTAQTLISLPGYRSLLALDSGVHLTLWGNLPEFSAFPPVLESVVMLHVPAAGTDLDFTLDRGRVVVANRKNPAGPARVRLRFLREAWELELPDHKSEVALELWGLPQKPADDRGRASPPTCLGLFTKGRVLVKTPRETLDLADHSRVSWQNLEPEKAYRTALPELPAWWAKQPDNKTPKVQKALRSLLDWGEQLGGSNASPEKRATPTAETAPVVTTIKTQVEEVKDPDNQDVGVFFLAALDEVEPLVDCLKDRQNPNVRGATVLALQAWLSRGGQHAAELVRILEKRGVARDKADLVVRLLHFYTPDALDRRQTYEELVNQLDDEEFLVRHLSFWQLDQLGVGGRLPAEAKMIDYDPSWDAQKRQPAVEQWRKLVASGKVPSRQ